MPMPASDGEPMSGGICLGIDLGTSAVKAVALDAQGAVMAFGSADYATHAEQPGQAEQESNDWLQAMAKAVSGIGGQLGPDFPGRVMAIGLAGQLPTLVCMGDQGPVGRAIAWTDGRADQWAAERLDAEPFLRADLYRRTGMPLDGRYLAPMFAFHKRANVRHILSAKDFLCFALTGRLVTDPSTASGYGLYALIG